MEYIKRYNVLVIFFVIVCILTMVFYPVLISKSAYDGAKMWSISIFPTLFPFFVCSNMLIDLGFAKFMGELLSPIMIPLFGVSGLGSFPFFSGIMSGYPVGAKLTSNLYEDKKLNREEGQRLLAFCNNCGPLFIIGVVGGYIFKNIFVGYYILFVHILTAIVYGMLINMIFGNVNAKRHRQKNFVREAFKQMRLHTANNNKTFGHILSDAVEGGVKSSLVVLGFVVLFSVVSQIIELFHIHEIIIYFVNSILPMDISGKSIEAMFLGAIEMTAGLFLIDGTLSQLNVMIAVFIVTFGGFSVHAQAISFISKTDLNAGRYILDKFLGGLLSLLMVFITFPFFKIVLRTVAMSDYVSNGNIAFGYSSLRDFYSISVFIIFVLIIFGCLFVKMKKSTI